MLSGAGGNQVSQGILAYLGVAPTAHHCIPFGNIYTAWMADQVVVHSSHISILVSCHRAINVVEYGVLITIELTVFKPRARLSKEYIKRDLRVVEKQGHPAVRAPAMLPSVPDKNPTSYSLQLITIPLRLCSSEPQHSCQPTFLINYDMNGEKKLPKALVQAVSIQLHL